MSHPAFDPGGQPLDPNEPGGPIFYAEPPQKKGRGCFFWGCISALIVGGLGLLLFVAVGVFAYFQFNKLVQEYTADAPEPVPVVNLPEDQQKAIYERWDAFRKSLDDGKDAEIVLNSDEINTLIDRESELKGKVYAKLDGDKVGAKVSYPLGETKIPGLGGRFLNGDASFTVSLDEKGNLDVRLQEFEVKGKKMSPQVKAQIAGNNLAEQYISNPKNREFISKFRKVEIKDSKVYIQARGAAAKDDESKNKADDKAKSEDVKPDDNKPKADEAKPAEPPAKKDDAPAAKPDEAKPADTPAPKIAA